MHASPCVFRHCHCSAPLFRLAYRKHLHVFTAKRDPLSHWRTPPHCLNTTLLRASHLHNVTSRHHFCRYPHHCTSHRLPRAPAASRKSGLSRILGHRETLTLGHCYRLCEILTLGHYCNPYETLALGRC